ncbi:MAG: signal peptide peptidase SppA [Bacteroidales bacterium]
MKKGTSFWKIMLASMVGFILANVVIMLIFFGSIGAMVSSFSKPKTVEVKEKSVLELDLSLPIPDRTPVNPFESFNFDPYDMKKIVGLNDILRGLEHAKDDDQIEGVYLDLSVVTSGMATLTELHDAIEDFKENGKWVIAYADMMSQKAYYMATVADELYLNPQGWMDFRGLTAQVMYYKTALDKLGVEPQIFRHGKFKSAVEPFMSDTMSEANRHQILTYTTSIWDNMLEEITDTRGISKTELDSIASKLMLSDARSAMELGFVDDLKYKDEILNIINDKTGEEPDEDINFITMGKYKETPVKLKKKHESTNEIAVIFAQGNIVMDKGDEKNIGGERYAEAVRKARQDEDVKAIVLRVNSPGGSGLASEIIWRELTLAKKDKPVVVSMGNTAASGGYYIACNADHIYAQPTTITGSIGVFGLMFSAEELLTEKIGINVEVVNTNDHADMGNIARSFDERESAYMQNMVEDFYDTFITRVAEGRDLTKSEVDEIGQGRVWTGENALEKGLVDEMGGLENAVEKAAELAELEKYRIQEYPKVKDFMDQFLSEFKFQTNLAFIKNIPGINNKTINRIKTFKELDEGVQARMPMDVEFE